MECFRTADGLTLSYRVEGAGPALVSHPGGPGFSARYLGDLAGLGERFTLVLLDPRGTGGSERPDDPRAYRTEDYVSDVDALRRHLGLERMLLLGHSHGGVVAAAYAATYPERVQKLVLASTLARFGAEQREAMEEAMALCSDEPWYEDARAAQAAEEAGDYADDEELREIVRRELPFYFARYGDDERRYVEHLHAERPNPDPLQLFNAEIIDTFDLRPDLAKVTAPTLVITGEEDFITGPACAADFAAIPDARIVVIPGCGHFVFFEARDRFRDDVAVFLSE